MDGLSREERFAALAPALIDAVRRYLARRADAATAEDVLADTLLVCWRRFDEVPDELLPWAYGVARNCLANARRGERRRVRLAARLAVVDPPRDVGAPEPPDGDLAAALATMRPDDAEVLRLWAWEDLAPAQIARVLGVSANAAAIRLHRAKSRLREALRKTTPVAGHAEAGERSLP
jgi:RNA polymerase sigma-70 factor, ECF subfamily